ncbi:MAG: hypothetical protein WAU68_11785 [Vitreimonas sp.]
MPPTSFSEMFRGGALQRDPLAMPKLAPRKLFDRRGPENANELRGKVQRSSSGGGSGASASRLSKGLDQRLGSARRFGFRKTTPFGGRFDARQRAVVKVHYFGHSGGGGAALKAHARYVAREAAALEQPAPALTPERQAEAHSSYLSRDGRESFYDASSERVDGATRAAEWAHADRRHFRVILAPENGAELGDLKPYVRGVMARAETALGARLTWVAIDHWDTDNPHTHVILRGRDATGRSLILPRDFIKHGFRNLARDAATERLGNRTPADERRALDREARAHRPTRLDAILARQLKDDGRLRLRDVRTPGEPALENALKARARELHRLGLADALGRNVFRFDSDWRDRLKAMELHLDVRKRIMKNRAIEQTLPLPGIPKSRSVER